MTTPSPATARRADARRLLEPGSACAAIGRAPSSSSTSIAATARCIPPAAAAAARCATRRPDYRAQWTSSFRASQAQPPNADDASVVIFRLGAEWLALPTAVGRGDRRTPCRSIAAAPARAACCSASPTCAASCSSACRWRTCSASSRGRRRSEPASQRAAPAPARDPPRTACARSVPSTRCTASSASTRAS